MSSLINSRINCHGLICGKHAVKYLLSLRVTITRPLVVKTLSICLVDKGLEKVCKVSLKLDSFDKRFARAWIFKTGLDI